MLGRNRPPFFPHDPEDPQVVDLEGVGPAAAAASTRRPTWGRSASRGTAGVATYARFPAA